MRDLLKVEKARDRIASLATKYEAEYNSLFIKGQFEQVNEYLVLSKTCVNAVSDLTNNLATLSRVVVGIRLVSDTDRRRAETLGDEIITEIEGVANSSLSFIADLEFCVKQGRSDDQVRERFGEELEKRRTATNTKIRQLQNLIATRSNLAKAALVKKKLGSEMKYNYKAWRIVFVGLLLGFVCVFNLSGLSLKRVEEPEREGSAVQPVDNRARDRF